MDSLKKVPHGEQCDKALEHYTEVSHTASSWSSLVPEAIEFFKKHYVPQGERQIVTSTRLFEDALKEGWVVDPWLNPRGMPTILTDSDYYWVMVKGTPEQIAGLDPIAELPGLEEEPEPRAEPYGLKTMFISYNSEEEAPDGYVVMHKDHIFAKGTVYTLPPKRAAESTA